MDRGSDTCIHACNVASHKCSRASWNLSICAHARVHSVHACLTKWRIKKVTGGELRKGHCNTRFYNGALRLCTSLQLAPTCESVGRRDAAPGAACDCGCAVGWKAHVCACSFSRT